jgi:hypothetical protein
MGRNTKLQSTQLSCTEACYTELNGINSWEIFGPPSSKHGWTPGNFTLLHLTKLYDVRKRINFTVYSLRDEPRNTVPE